MAGKFNGYASWVGLGLVLVANIVIVTIAFARVEARANNANERVSKVEKEQEGCRELLQKILERTSRMEGALETMRRSHQ